VRDALVAHNRLRIDADSTTGRRRYGLAPALTGSGPCFRSHTRPAIIRAPGDDRTTTARNPRPSTTGTAPPNRPITGQRLGPPSFRLPLQSRVNLSNLQQNDEGRLQFPK
jgi:hypothetical protein